MVIIVNVIIELSGEWARDQRLWYTVVWVPNYLGVWPFGTHRGLSKITVYLSSSFNRGMKRLSLI